MKKYIMGVDLGGTHIKSAIFDTELNTVFERSDSTEAALGPAHILDKIKKHRHLRFARHIFKR
ncbi:hypothetical protein MALU111345_17665 [Marinicrinis lubricantis]